MKVWDCVKSAAKAVVVKSKALVAVALFGGVAAVAMPAHADGVDVTAVTTALTGAGTTLGTVGAAIIGALVIAVVYKWVKGMLFG